MWRLLAAAQPASSKAHAGFQVVVFALMLLSSAQTL
jgi:hypothetical protein